MKREIKFRGKRVDNDKWVYGSLLINPIDGVCKIMTVLKTVPEYFEVIPNTVGQFIGIKDKKGKDIYEGDIVENNKKYKIIWYKYFFAIEDQAGNNFQIEYNTHLYFEVIGNIYETPELLK